MGSGRPYWPTRARWNLQDPQAHGGQAIHAPQDLLGLCFTGKPRDHFGIEIPHHQVRILIGLYYVFPLCHLRLQRSDPGHWSGDTWPGDTRTTQARKIHRVIPTRIHRLPRLPRTPPDQHPRYPGLDTGHNSFSSCCVCYRLPSMYVLPIL